MSAVCTSLPASTNDDSWTKSARLDISRIQAAFEKFDRQTDAPTLLDEWLNELSQVRTKAQKCIDSNTENLDKLKKSVDVIPSDEIPEHKTTDTANQEIRARLAIFKGQLQECRVIHLDVGLTIDQIRDAQSEILKTHLLSREPTIWDISLLNLQQADSLLPLIKSLLFDRLQLGNMRSTQWGIFGLLSGIAVLIGVSVRIWIRRRLRIDEQEGYTVALLNSLQSCTATSLPLLLPLVFAATYLLYILPNEPLAPSVAVLVALLVFLAGSILIRVFLNPCAPAKHFLKTDPGYTRALGKHLYSLLVLVLLGVLFYGLEVRETLSEEQWMLVRAVFLTIAVLLLLWFVAAVRKAPAPFNSRKLQGLLMLVLMIGLGAEYTGYRNLSVYLLGGLVGTTILGSVIWMVNVLLLELFDGLDEGRFAWERRLRSKLGLAPDDPMPGLIWLRLLMTVIIWLVFFAGLLLLWGYDESIWRLLREGFIGGFQVAGMQVVPVNLLIAIALFSLLVTLVSWIRNEILPEWVDRTRLSLGAKEATLTISGYVGIILAALFGLSLAGFNFTNLAIVVGALSVGIGFGLQNIVNNFISGLILLFERPIRRGDWIVVGNTEGYVRKISIRSTQIETFDRADVIVPNSELISNQVTNWMLRDPMGRVIVPIGVAYGTDIERLREILLQVASEHPLVIQNGAEVSPPKVLFRGFGDSSLDFELRAFIREVDQRLNTLSELNFAIERMLREADIQIPFPQRDLHLRSVEAPIEFMPMNKE